MKRILTLLAASAALLAASCQKDDTSASGRRSGEVDVAIQAALPQSIGTYAARSAGSDKGGVNNVDPASYDLRYIMEVWSTGDVPAVVYREVKTVGDWTSNSAVTFNARLIAKKYDFVFWADFVNAGSQDDLHYATAVLNNVAFNGTYAISDDAHDAYYGKQTVDLSEQGATIGGILLKRPFGKLRLVSTDKPVNDGAGDPAAVTLEYGDNTFYKAFNALGGVTCESKTAHAGPLSCVASTEGEVYLLAYDYILAAGDLTSLSGVQVKIVVDGETYTKALPTIPIAANKLTTVKGNFYTNEGTLTVDVEDAFDAKDEITVDGEIVTETIGEINRIIASSVDDAGKSVSVKLTEPVADNPAIISIPDAVTAVLTPQISINLSKGIAEGKKLIVGKEDGGQAVDTNFDGTINIIVPETAGSNLGDLDIKAPNAHVTINGQYVNVSALTSAGTLVVEKGSAIENLTIVGGNAKIYGTAANVTNSGSGKIYLALGPGSDRDDARVEPANSTLVKDALATEWADGIIFTEGRYPLNCNMKNSGYPQETFYMAIGKPGFELIGEGDKDKIILYGCEYTPNGAWGGQQLITVLSAGVTIENLTLMPKQECNKTVEVLADNFAIRNCNIVPNTLVVPTSGDAGCIWLGRDDATTFSNMTVENCMFDNAGISVRPGTTATVRNNTFKGVRAVEPWYACIMSKGTANLSGNTYLNVTTDKGKEALMALGTGKIVSDNDIFPNTEDVFWTVEKQAVLIVNGQEIPWWSLAFETALCPAGTFTMGTDRATRGEYQHQVTLSKDFYMCKYQITTTQFAEFLNDIGVGSNGVCPATDVYPAAKYPGQELVKENGVNYQGYDIGVIWNNEKNCWIPSPGYENNPIVYESWYGAYEFAHWAGGSLPSESQWEYAYRAGTATKYFFGDTDENLGDYAWYSGNKQQGVKTHEVGTRNPNSWGLYDMGGNTYEWTLYRYHEEYGSSKNAMDYGLTDPDNGNAYGGSWAMRSCDYKTDSDKLRSAFRTYSMHRDTFNQMIGFRVVFGPGADMEFFAAAGN